MTIVYGVIIVILVLSVIGKIYQKKDSFSLEEILAMKISAIAITDQGLSGDRQLSITNADSVRAFLKIVGASQPVDFQSLHIKIGAGTCEILFKDSLGKTYQTVLTDESKDKGVLRSGDDFYRNDALLAKTIEELNRTK